MYVEHRKLANWFTYDMLIFLFSIKFGIQAYYGGQAVTVVLGSIFPQYLHLENTLPER